MKKEKISIKPFNKSIISKNSSKSHIKNDDATLGKRNIEFQEDMNYSLPANLPGDSFVDSLERFSSDLLADFPNDFSNLTPNSFEPRGNLIKSSKIEEESDKRKNLFNNMHNLVPKFTIPHERVEMNVIDDNKISLIKVLKPEESIVVALKYVGANKDYVNGNLSWGTQILFREIQCCNKGNDIVFKKLVLSPNNLLKETSSFVSFSSKESESENGEIHYYENLFTSPLVIMKVVNNEPKLPLIEHNSFDYSKIKYPNRSGKFALEKIYKSEIIGNVYNENQMPSVKEDLMTKDTLTYMKCIDEGKWHKIHNTKNNTIIDSAIYAGQGFKVSVSSCNILNDKTPCGAIQISYDLENNDISFDFCMLIANVEKYKESSGVYIKVSDTNIGIIKKDNNENVGIMFKVPENMTEARDLVNEFGILYPHFKYPISDGLPLSYLTKKTTKTSEKDECALLLNKELNDQIKNSTIGQRIFNELNKAIELNKSNFAGLSIKNSKSKGLKNNSEVLNQFFRDEYNKVQSPEELDSLKMIKWYVKENNPHNNLHSNAYFNNFFNTDIFNDDDLIKEHNVVSQKPMSKYCPNETIIERPDKSYKGYKFLVKRPPNKSHEEDKLPLVKELPKKLIAKSEFSSVKTLLEPEAKVSLKSEAKTLLEPEAKVSLKSEFECLSFDNIAPNQSYDYGFYDEIDVQKNNTLGDISEAL